MAENLNMDEVTEARREAIERSIHTISVEELRSLGEELLPYAEHPWREKFFTYIKENEDTPFFHATTHDRIHIFYSPAKNRGMWFMIGSGYGPLQPKGLAILSEIVERGGGRK
jgi:hypothetical protein